MSFSVQILGISSATEAYGRHQSSQILRTDDHVFLIDCGEGTQSQLRRRKVNLNKISCIFISHLHGDHYLGLVGLISTMNLLGRTKPLTIYGPWHLKEIIQVQFKHSGTVINYPLTFTPTNPETSEVIFESKSLRVSTIPLQHGVPCTGFLFKETAQLRKIKPENLPKGLSRDEIYALKESRDIILQNGEEVKYLEHTIAPTPPRAYAYCSDTSYTEDILDVIKNVDLLYHETSFLDKHAHKAENTNHSTSVQAATIALKANVRKLLMGHFSARYSELDQFEVEAQEIFPTSEVAKEGEMYFIPKSPTAQSESR